MNPPTDFLRFIKVNFRNQIIQPTWYNGIEKIGTIDFYECNIKAIRSNAFNVLAFRSTTSIHFHYLDELIYIENNAFAGMPIFKSLSFDCASLVQVGPAIVWGFERTLYFLRFHRIFGSFCFQDFLGTETFVNVHVFDIQENLANIILAPGNFTKFHAIRMMEFRSAGIEAILDGTFDSVAKTLRFLQLSKNKLTHIRPELFYSFILTEPDPQADLPEGVD